MRPVITWPRQPERQPEQHPERRPRPETGFTLVEVVVALLLLELFLFGALLSLRLGAARANAGLVLEQVIWEAGALADSISYLDVDGSPARDRPWGSLARVGDRLEARDPDGRLLIALELGP